MANIYERTSSASGCGVGADDLSIRSEEGCVGVSYSNYGGGSKMEGTCLKGFLSFLSLSRRSGSIYTLSVYNWVA